MNASTAGGEPIPGERWVGAAGGTVIDDIGPEPGGRGLAGAGSQHLDRRIVGIKAWSP